MRAFYAVTEEGAKKAGIIKEEEPPRSRWALIGKSKGRNQASLRKANPSVGSKPKIVGEPSGGLWSLDQGFEPLISVA